MLGYYLMDPGTDVYQTEQPQISYSIDLKAEQSSAIGSRNLLGQDAATATANATRPFPFGSSSPLRT